MIYSDRGFNKLQYQFEKLSLKQLAIIKKGNKKCIIFLHGIGGSKISLTGLASAFYKKNSAYNLFLPDLPGSGSAIILNFDDKTFKKWFKFYLNLISNEYDKVIIIGHSLGAYQCIINANLLNKNCQKLILVCPVLGLDIIAKTAHSFFDLIGKIDEGFATSLASSGSMIKLSNSIMVKASDKTKLKILNSRLQELDIVNKPSWFKQYQHIQKIISNPNFQNQLSKIKIKTLVIGARKDVITETGKYLDIAAKNNWDLVISEDCGHQLPNEDPGWLANKINDFLKN